MDKLPDFVKEIINQRSSRNPGSRFSRKIHILLSYVETNPEMVDLVGLKWISDEHFRMNKKILKELLNIKENSLNVNLKKLDFIQTQSDKGGWTEWYKKDFNKIESNPFQNEIITISEDQFPRLLSPSVFQPANQNSILMLGDELYNKVSHCSIGFIDEERKHNVIKQAIQIWQSIVTIDHTDIIFGADFILQLAKRLQLEGQSFNNAVSVIKNILVTNEKSGLAFLNFFKMYCAFGPDGSIMQKIASLLDIAAGENGWLYFGFPPSEIKKVTDHFAYFDENEPNCLVLISGSSIFKVWNIPDIKHTDRYIYGEDGNYYSDWSSYIRTTPFNIYLTNQF